MHRFCRPWFIALGVLLVVPLGLRVLTWPRTKDRPLDHNMAAAGEVLFKHEWKPNDRLAAGGDGLGPVFNARSCVACHEKGGVGGAGGVEMNVTMFVLRPTLPGGQVKEGVVHAAATRFRETLQDVDPQLPAISNPTLSQLLGTSKDRISVPMSVSLSQRNTPALFGAKLIDAIPASAIIAMEKKERLRWGLATSASKELPVGRAVRLTDGRIGRFGWKAQTASLAEFVQAACSNELGLGNPGKAQPIPLGKPDYQGPGLDLTQEQCDQLTEFVASLDRPEEVLPHEDVARAEVLAGKKLFHAVGCAECHVPDLGDVKGMYSDLLIHYLGEPLQASGVYYGPPPEEPIFKPGASATAGEWRTPPLWGVADSAPYLHDGRAETLEEAIQAHGGQGKSSAERFGKLTASEGNQLLAFLKSLRAPGAK